MAWLIVQSPSGTEEARDSSDRFAGGVIVAARTRPPGGQPPANQGGPAVFELFIWVRRAYRSAGLGTLGLRGTLRTIREELNAIAPGHRLRARYPKAGVGDNELEYGNFLGFLAAFDFRPFKDPPFDGHGYSTLELK
jgi:hypothetical protein